jgi:hypothetical protein
MKMNDDIIHFGWLESDENLKLWRKLKCPRPQCVYTIKLDPHNLQNNKKVFCPKCGFSFLYQFGQLFPEGARFPEPLPSISPISEDILQFFNIFIDVLGSIETGKNNLPGT